MSIFNPELKECKETNYEHNKFSPDVEKKLLEAMEDKKESYPDIIQCPNRSCGNPLTVEIREDAVFVSCVNCGWNTIIKKTKGKT